MILSSISRTTEIVLCALPWGCEVTVAPDRGMCCVYVLTLLQGVQASAATSLKS
jgi:hypothetical protein